MRITALAGRCQYQRRASEIHRSRPAFVFVRQGSQNDGALFLLVKRYTVPARLSVILFVLEPYQHDLLVEMFDQCVNQHVRNYGTIEGTSAR
jgi:hypothetical protein